MKRKFFFWSMAAAGWIGGMYFVKLRIRGKMQSLQDRVDILSDHFQLLNHWLEIKGEGKSTASYFEELGYFHIAVYGMAELANRLCEDLKGSPVQIIYGIDRDVSCSAARIAEVYFPEDELPPVDAIVVTPYFSFRDIKSTLEKRVCCPVISLEDIVWSI